MERMHKIAEVVFGEELEILPTYFEGNPPSDVNKRLWYLGESIKKMSEADYFIGIYDAQKEYDGCLIENYTAKLYNLRRYSVRIEYIAPDVMEQRDSLWK